MTFEIFKTGKHTNSNGIEKEFSEADLDNIVNTYDPDKREAPLVLGHPKDNAPAYGWVEKLFRKGTSLFAKSKDEDPSFLQAVKDRKFPKRSISLTEDGRLNHIGFLGAVLPAVEGLSPVTFNISENYSTYEEELSQVELDDNIKEDNDISLNNSNGESTAIHNNIPPDPVRRSSQNADGKNNQSLHPKPDLPLDILKPKEESQSYSQTINEISQTLSQLKTLTENISQNFASSDTVELSDTERQKIRTQLENLKMKIDSNNFEVLLNEKLLWGSLTPVMKQKISKTIKFLNNQNFSEFDSERFVLELKTQLMDFVNSIPKIVDTSEFALKPDDDPLENSKDNYDGLAVDESSQSLHKKVLNKMKDKNVSYLSALKLVMKN